MIKKKSEEIWLMYSCLFVFPHGSGSYVYFILQRTKIISELLISVSKAERQEARMKVRQESLRLGNVGVIRAGTIISEAWEDGQALKDLNAQLVRSLIWCSRKRVLVFHYRDMLRCLY